MHSHTHFIIIYCGTNRRNGNQQRQILTNTQIKQTPKECIRFHEQVDHVRRLMSHIQLYHIFTFYFQQSVDLLNGRDIFSLRV